MFKYKYDELFNPLLTVMHELGGSATVEEIERGVAKLLKLKEAEISDIHRGTQTKLEYRLAWARTYLKKFGIMQNSKHGVWVLTSKGKKTFEVDKSAVKKNNAVLYRQSVQHAPESTDNSTDNTELLEIDSEITWKEKLLEKLKSLSPAAFERLTQQLLRELGFSNVEVTGRSGDGGIDGIGIVKINGVLSFHVVFQCKRFRNTVGPNLIRELRGALGPHIDKGLFVTTGRFTASAKAEAARTGAVAIDLIDGDDFVERLKALRIGVEVKQRTVEDVYINDEWFDNI